MSEIFLSHTGVDKPIVRKLAVQLQLAGAAVFLDEWSIEVGESITGAIEEAIGRFDVFVLVWSSDANKSLWTRREYRTAIKKVIEDANRRFVLLKLDKTPVPDLVSDLKFFDFTDQDVGPAVDAILRFKGPADRLQAIQAFLEESGIEVELIHGYGPIVGCPKCGADLKHIESWSQVDHKRDDLYAGARCNKCGWNNGGEVLF
ncbi:MAG: hypothetical protein JWO11_3920 [Nocardioides sp.]|nr:hypothetical protein [Nocardioides sp.]